MTDETKISKYLWDNYCKDINNQLADLKIVCENKINEYKDTVNKILNEYPKVLTFERDGIKFQRLTHFMFDKVLKIITSQKRIQKNVMLVGPAGSGKTQLCADIADAVKLQFYPMSVGPQTTKSDLLGFVNPYGNYITTPVREAFEKGGVLLLDEFDAAHPGVVTILNSLLANGHCSFPDKIVHKHKDFICIVACNTFGDGSSYQYVGRNKLDAATLDRFVTIDIGYDQAMQKTLTQNDMWKNLCDDIMKNAITNGIDIVISTRTMLNGADLIDCGFTLEEALTSCVFKGVANDVKKILMNGIEIKDNKYNRKTQEERDKISKDNVKKSKIKISFED